MSNEDLLERVMNFELNIEWFPDAGGITEISRWRKPPVRNTERGQPRQGLRNDAGRFPQPLPGLIFVVIPEVAAAT
jgi:hypothetical protein